MDEISFQNSERLLRNGKKAIKGLNLAWRLEHAPTVTVPLD